MTSEPEEPLPAPCLVVVTERETVSDGEGSLPIDGVEIHRF